MQAWVTESILLAKAYGSSFFRRSYMKAGSGADTVGCNGLDTAVRSTALLLHASLQQDMSLQYPASTVGAGSPSSLRAIFQPFTNKCLASVDFSSRLPTSHHSGSYVVRIQRRNTVCRQCFYLTVTIKSVTSSQTGHNRTKTCTTPLQTCTFPLRS